MDWKTLFLSVEGRIGQKDFWIGMGILVVALIISRQLPWISGLWALASLYFSVCIGGKRLHDVGKSAWLVVLPLGIVLASYALGAIIGGAAFLGMAATGSDTAAVLGGIAGIGLAGLIGFAGFVVSLGAVVWLGIQKGDASDNQFGPPREVPLVTAI
jgi:uncharacterized membrane protein YhaH (DUF805 family)